MAITQLSAFLENTPGTLYKAVCAISDAGVNLRALSVADTRDFGILRVIVSDIDKTVAALSDDTIITRTSVIAVRMSDKAGALKQILSILQAAGINIEYVYAFTANAANSALSAPRKPLIGLRGARFCCLFQSGDIFHAVLLYPCRIFYCCFSSFGVKSASPIRLSWKLREIAITSFINVR